MITMNVEVLDNGVKLITLDGSLDMAGHTTIENKFSSTTGEKEPVLVDLSDVDFIASIGIRLLLSSAKKLQAQGGKLGLLNPQPMVMDVLTHTGIAPMIPIYDDLDAACAELSAAVGE